MSKRKLANREKDMLGFLGADPTVNSGATFGDGDGLIKLKFPFGFYAYQNIYVEVKCTDHKSFSVTRNLWKKVNKEAGNVNAMPLLAVDLEDEDRFIVMDLNDFMAIVDYMEEILEVLDERNKIRPQYDNR